MKVRLVDDPDGRYFELEDGDERLRIRPFLFVRKAIGLKTDLLAKAIGFKKGLCLKVVDATAGLCRDADHLASLGCEVVAIEQNETLYRGLRDYPKKFELIHGHAVDYLANLADVDKPDVVYLDPMFAESKKSAKSGKETVLLQALCAPPNAYDERELLRAARVAARKRVVVKRARLAPPLGGEYKPNHQIVGKAVRYDVYLIL